MAADGRRRGLAWDCGAAVSNLLAYLELGQCILLTAMGFYLLGRLLTGRTDADCRKLSDLIHSCGGRDSLFQYYGSFGTTVDSKNIEYGPGTIYADLGFGVGGRSCSNFLASTVKPDGPALIYTHHGPRVNKLFVGT